jgi:hypothetical protein
MHHYSKRNKRSCEPYVIWINSMAKEEMINTVHAMPPPQGSKTEQYYYYSYTILSRMSSFFCFTHLKKY